MVTGVEEPGIPHACPRESPRLRRAGTDETAEAGRTQPLRATMQSGSRGCRGPTSSPGGDAPERKGALASRSQTPTSSVRARGAKPDSPWKTWERPAGRVRARAQKTRHDEQSEGGPEACPEMSPRAPAPNSPSPQCQMLVVLEGKERPDVLFPQLCLCARKFLRLLLRVGTLVSR